MKPGEAIYTVWAPADSIWSPWVMPTPFVDLVCLPIADEEKFDALAALAGAQELERDLAIVADLPGAESVRYGLALATRGYRPVPLFNGSPVPTLFPTAGSLFSERMKHGHASRSVIDMEELLRALCAGATVLPDVRLGANAPPVFLLDAMRMKGHRAANRELFDNRWKVFAQDFPSAKFLKEHGIRRVLLVQNSGGQPQEDLAHVLLRWQEAGVKILSSDRKDLARATTIRVSRPSGFRRSWHRGLALLGLRRNNAGGFGGWPHDSSAG